MLGIQVDHIFYTGTDRAVKNFQSTHGLVSDGKVGINTLKELLK